MSEKEKEGYYFKIIPKEQWQDFFNNFKNALLKTEKKKENKSCEFEIRTTKEDLKEACVFEIFTFDKARYFDYFDEQKDYFKNSLLSISLNFEVKEEKGVNEVENLFKSFFDDFRLKEYGFEFFSRNKGKQVSIDFIRKKSLPILEDLLDLGIDLTEYHKFNIALITGINIYDLLHEDDPDLILIEIFSLIFYIRAETDNCRYLLIALSEALKDVKIDNEKIQKKFDKFINFLRFINSFIRNKFKIEYDAKILAGKEIKNGGINDGGVEGLKAKIIPFQQMSIGMFQTMVIPMLQSLDLTGVIKSTDLDNISISLTAPKYKNGLALSLKIPELSKTLDELIDNYENSIKK